jgi:hypothetical protein
MIAGALGVDATVLADFGFRNLIRHSVVPSGAWLHCRSATEHTSLSPLGSADLPRISMQLCVFCACAFGATCADVSGETITNTSAAPVRSELMQKFIVFVMVAPVKSRGISECDYSKKLKISNA